MQLRHPLLQPLLGLVLAAGMAAAQAAVIPAGINVSLSAAFDDVNSLAVVNGNQSGQFSVTAGGIGNSSSFNNLTVSGSNPLNGNAGQTGDGAALAFSLSGSNLAQSDGVFGDVWLNFSNNGALGYKATFAVDMVYSNLSATGADAYVKFDFSLLDGGLNEVFHSFRQRDTLNGDIDDDSANNLIEVILNAGDSAAFHGIERVYGGSFDQQGSYGGDVSASLRLVSFTPLTNPPRQLPLPSTLWLGAAGLLMLWQQYKSTTEEQTS